MKNPFIKEYTEHSYCTDPIFGTREVRTIKYTKTNVSAIITACGIVAILAIAIVTAIVAVGKMNTTSNVTVNTVVEKQLEEVVTPTTVEAVRGQHVCSMPVSTSNEYALMELSSGDPAYTQFPSVYADTIVFVWEIDAVQSVIDTFKQDIEEYGRYVGKNMVVAMPGYVAQEGEFVVPVKFNELDRADDNYSAYIRWEGNFIFGYSAELAFNNDFFNNMDGWNNYHNTIVLHELGHLFGLDHTAIDNDGIDQHDSIMSYEGIWERNGLQAGDIAGLQKIFCN